MDGSASGSSSWSSSSSDSFGVAATGTWRVAFAPHIAKVRVSDHDDDDDRPKLVEHSTSISDFLSSHALYFFRR